MSLSCSNFHHLFSQQPRCSSSPLPPALSFCPQAASCSSNRIAQANIQFYDQEFNDAKEKIKMMFHKVELSVSAYDTAWIAMVPSPSTPNAPCFPGSIDWILENQVHDGSWGVLIRDNTSLMKDVLSSTLACVLALKRWSAGEEQITRGLDFIVSNFTSAMDENQHSPVGFDIIFASMIEKALKMDMNFHLASNDVDAMLQKKDLELKSIQGKNSKERNFYLAYISEAIGISQDWKMVMKYQRKNGSLFNSPSTTAAAFSELNDTKCYSYLTSILHKLGNAVPTIYPLEPYFQLYLVDSLQKLGISGHFNEEITSVLSKTFRLWEQGDDDIFSDVVTSMMAFRLLRDHGYDVSSELLAEYHDEDSYFDRFGGHLEDIRAALELFKASELRIHDHEAFLEKQTSYSRRFLERTISENSSRSDRFTKSLVQKVSDTLKSPYHGSLQQLESRKSVECAYLDDIRVLKSPLWWTNFCKKDLLKLAKDNFSYCQSIHQQELKQLQRWVVENRLDQLTFSRQKLSYCYFSAAASLPSPELSDARISWAKNGVLTTVVDDFFDIGSSEEEQLNLIQLVEKWEANEECQVNSEKVHIVFSALCNTIREIGDKAYAWQNRSITEHLVEIWLTLIKSMWKEAEMVRNKSVPTIEEYMENGYISFALGPIVLPTLYFIGPKLTEEVIRSEEYHKLFKLMSTCGRLLNDFQGCRREAEHGKLNAVSLLVLQGNGSISEEEAIREIRRTIDDKRRELLQMVKQGDRGVVPEDCRVVFWKMSKVLHLFYMKDDGFTSEDMSTAVKAVLQDPID